MDTASFLRSYPPFDALEESEIADIAGTVEIEFFAEGTRILEQGGATASATRRG